LGSPIVTQEVKKKINIRQVYSFCFLLLFTISITPKLYFHDAIANHRDVSSCNHPGKPKTCIHQQGYNCQVNDPIVSSPYLSVAISSCSLPEINFGAALAPFIISFLQDCFIHTESRGPPVA